MGAALHALRLSGPVIGVALTIGIALTGPGPVAAAEVLGWEDLAPPFDESKDPFAGLTEDQQAALFEFAMSGELDETDQLDEELAAYRAEARRTLVDAGLDLDALLARVDTYNEYLKGWNNTLIPELDGREVRIPGYALPLEFSGTTVTEFLLVPYVGACIHAPPPAPNQIVHVRTADGFESQGIFAPVWVTGRISTGRQSVSLYLVDGSSDVDVGYRLEAVDVEPYAQ